MDSLNLKQTTKKKSNAICNSTKKERKNERKKQKLTHKSKKINTGPICGKL